MLLNFHRKLRINAWGDALYHNLGNTYFSLQLGIGHVCCVNKVNKKITFQGKISLRNSPSRTVSLSSKRKPLLTNKVFKTYKKIFIAKFQIQKPFSVWLVKMALGKVQKVINAVKLIVKLELHSMFFSKSIL